MKMGFEHGDYSASIHEREGQWGTKPQFQVIRMYDGEWHRFARTTHKTYELAVEAVENWFTSIDKN